VDGHDVEAQDEAQDEKHDQRKDEQHRHPHAGSRVDRPRDQGEEAGEGQEHEQQEDERPADFLVQRHEEDLVEEHPAPGHVVSFELVHLDRIARPVDPLDGAEADAPGHERAAGELDHPALLPRHHRGEEGETG
jgi:hypothetical protein